MKFLSIENHVYHRSLLVLVLLLGLRLRLVGIERGRGDDDVAFYSFHPDETTLLRAAVDLHNPLDPPLTAYGLLPVYLARAVFANVDGADKAQLYRVARWLSALCSCLSLYLTWMLARRRLAPVAALLATLIFACAPLALQQAHFYTVDAVFVLLLLLFFTAWEGEIRPDWRRYLLVGALVGATGIVRLNGLAPGTSYFLKIFDCGWREPRRC